MITKESRLAAGLQLIGQLRIASLRCMAGRQRHRAFVCGSLAAALLLVGGAAPALAAKEHPYSGTSFGPEGAGAAANFGNVQAVGIDQSTGAVYVYDGNEGTLYKFDAAGEPSNFSATGDNSIDGLGGAGGGEAEIAVAPPGSPGGTGGDVYVAKGTAVLVFSEAGTQIGELTGGETCGVATDPTGHVFVGVYPETVREYTPTANPVTAGDQTATSTASLPGICNVGVDALGNIYAANFNGQSGVVKLEGIGDPTSSAIDPSASTVFVDPATDDLYADRGTSFAQYSSGGESIGLSGLSQLSNSHGIATSTSTNRVYVGNGANVAIFDPEVAVFDVSSRPATGVTASTATLNGAVSPANASVSNCHFEYGQTTSYGLTAPCVGSIPADELDHSVAASLSNLRSGTTYHFRLVVTKASEEEAGQALSFTTAGAGIEGTSIARISPESAQLEAVINPRGTVTSYRFDYGLSNSYGQSTPTLTLGSESFGRGVSQTIAGLNPETTYHFRAVAINALAETFSADQTFTTSAVAELESNCVNQLFRTGFGLGLPDCRAYEQATDVDKNGGGAEGAPDFVQASISGDGITFYSQAGVPGGTGAQDFPSFLASRAGGSWSTQGLLPSQGLGPIAGVLGLTQDLRFAFTEAEIPGIGAALLRKDTSTGEVTTIVPYRSDAESFGSSYVVAGASADGAVVFFESTLPLTGETPYGQQNLYVWHQSSHAVELVSVDGTGSVLPLGSFAGPYDWTNNNPFAGGAASSYYVQVANAISPSGAQVYFTARGSGRLFLRQGLGGNTPTTVEVSKSQKTNGGGPGGTDPTGPQPAAFLEASADGARGFFMSTEELTNDANTGIADEGADLYMYDAATGRLTDLTSDLVDPAGAQVQGLLGSSADGRTLYVAARGALAPGAVAGQNNLYLLEQRGSAWTTVFIARLAPGNGTEFAVPQTDSRNWSPQSYAVGGAQGPIGRTSRVSSDGKTLVFTSVRSLTGYANASVKCAGSGGACRELFRYSAGTNDLQCISCDPSGATPLGPVQLQSPEINAGALPTKTRIATRVRNMSADGSHVFFETPDPLVAKDVNGTSGCVAPGGKSAERGSNCQDVYEWEAAGTGSCPVDARSGGCLYLLSSGQGDQATYFGDADEAGRNVFIFTQSQLVPVDGDELFDIYDARELGGLAGQHELPREGCNGEACQGPISSTPGVIPSGSSALVGPGNPKPREAKKHHRKHKKHHRKHKCKKKNRKCKRNRHHGKQGGAKHKRGAKK